MSENYVSDANFDAFIRGLEEAASRYNNAQLVPMSEEDLNNIRKSDDYQKIFISLKENMKEDVVKASQDYLVERSFETAGNMIVGKVATFITDAICIAKESYTELTSDNSDHDISDALIVNGVINAISGASVGAIFGVIGGVPGIIAGATRGILPGFCEALLGIMKDNQADFHDIGYIFLGQYSYPNMLSIKDLEDNQDKYNTITTSKKVGLPDPIVINLGDQEGFDTKSLAESDAYFDTNQNGFAEKTGWIGENSGILTRDVNGNGVIDGGAEVFGDSTILSDGTKAATGFDALRDLDSNGDGIISAEDAMYDTLRVWRDDGDGISQSEELKTLSELGIKSISLDSETVNSTDGKGNTITRTSNVEFSDGTKAA